MKRILRFVGWVAALAVIGRVVGALMTRRFVAGSTPSDDDFRVAAIMGGAEVTSTASALRSVRVKSVFGGVSLDLTEATLSPDGATVDIEISMGGVAMSVGAQWRVEIDSTLTAGDVVAELADPDALAPDAPRLTVRVRGRAGGVAISGS